MSGESVIDLEQLRRRAGIDEADTSRDADLEAAWAQAFALCERYCDRIFELGADVMKFPPPRANLTVRRFPIVSVESLTWADGTLADPITYAIYEEPGIVCVGAGLQIARLEYTGGFAELPADLEGAILQAFDALWYATPSWGAGAGTDPASEVKSVSIVGVGSMDFGAPASASESQLGKLGAYGVLPVASVAVLNLYRRHTVAGGA